MLDPRRFLYVPLEIPPVDFDRGRLLSYFDEPSLWPPRFLKCLGFSMEHRANSPLKTIGPLPTDGTSSSTSQMCPNEE